MTTRFLDADRMASLSADRFRAQKPFPWLNERLLRSNAFDRLCRDFPSLDRFELHRGIPRIGGQRPHNRHYLAYERSVYAEIDHSHAGIVRRDELPASWQTFIDELSDSAEYRVFASRLLGADRFEVRYAWHVGVTGSEVSPHRDSERKLGTHIFYFNTDRDWDPAWGGDTLVLDGKLTDAPNPDFHDFAGIERSPMLDNRSFLFRNTIDAWHGVEALTCPEGRYRRIFNVIFESTDANRAG